ncbi:two-partner secretion system transporter TpsB2, partial [Pseudomonas aeruginosa]|nr:two-partner secretion system transporter TpsB2 [Pseudomonas aeruginosa]
ELVPGSEVGGSRVRLKGERDKPWRVSATRNNDGDVSTGEQQMGLGLDWDSPLGLADQLNLRANRDAVTDRWRHSDSQSLFYSLPWGWWTFTYGYSQSDYRTRNEASGFPFKLDGDSRSHQFRAERVLHRDGVSKTAMSLGLSHQRTNNYVEDTRLEDQSTRITETQLGFNHGRRIGSGFVNLDLGWQQGIGALGAQGRGHPQAGDPNARYDKYSLTLSYLQPFQLWGERFSFDSLATGQRSEDVLFSPQRISLGGNSSVRGFKDQTLTGDSGGYWRNQLRWRRAVEWAPLRPWLQEYGVAFAYDVGVIRHDRYNDGASGRMSGNAIELDARGRYFAASVGFARSLERPSAIERRE